jgi:hypothetical protein
LGSSSAIARRTSTRLTAVLTCVNSVGEYGSAMSNSGSVYASVALGGWNGTTVSGPPVWSQKSTPCASANATSFASSDGDSGARMRSTSA